MTSRTKPLRQDHELRCPRDGAHMAKLPHQTGVVLDHCPTCAGLWFDTAELERVAGDTHVEAEATRRLPVTQPSGFGCPRCWGDCERTQVGSIPVDTCTSCNGVWLDAGELDGAIREAKALQAARAAMTPLQRVLLRMRR